MTELMEGDESSGLLLTVNRKKAERVKALAE
jgi:hypothetical protein